MEVQNVNAEKYTDQQAYEMAIDYANSPENRERIYSKFVHAFGKNAAVRTRKQWCNLVRVYSLEKVSEMEGLTEEQVNFNCLSLTERLKQYGKSKLYGQTAKKAN